MFHHTYRVYMTEFRVSFPFLNSCTHDLMISFYFLYRKTQADYKHSEHLQSSYEAKLDRGGWYRARRRDGGWLWSGINKYGKWVAALCNSRGSRRHLPKHPTRNNSYNSGTIFYTVILYGKKPKNLNKVAHLSPDYTKLHDYATQKQE